MDFVNYNIPETISSANTKPKSVNKNLILCYSALSRGCVIYNKEFSVKG